jgi:hypothetical protein
MKKFCIFLLIGIAVNTVFAQDVYKILIAKDGENTVRISRDYINENIEVYDISTRNEKWEWYTYEEFEYVIMVAHEPHKRVDYFRPPDCVYDYLSHSMELGAERDKAILQQTLIDIKKGIKVSKPIGIAITTDGTIPDMLGCSYGYSPIPCNYIGWANWYVYSYTFNDKAGKEVNLGVYETRGGLFNALKFYYNKEVLEGRMTKREANKFYKEIAHDVRNCDEVPLSDKLLNYKNLYNPYIYKPGDKKPAISIVDSKPYGLLFGSVLLFGISGFILGRKFKLKRIK